MKGFKGDNKIGRILKRLATVLGYERHGWKRQLAKDLGKSENSLATWVARGRLSGEAWGSIVNLIEEKNLNPYVLFDAGEWDIAYSPKTVEKYPFLKKLVIHANEAARTDDDDLLLFALEYASSKLEGLRREK